MDLFLIHYKYNAAPFSKSKGKSPCDNVASEIKKHMPDYCKNYPNLYEILKPKIDTAIANAKKLEKNNQRTGSTNPATSMHELVDDLMELKK